MKQKITVGFKLLKGNKSLNGEFTYDLSGKWQTVPGNGAYVAVTGGLHSSGVTGGDNYVVMECKEPMKVEGLPDGTQCFRKVRVKMICCDSTRVALAMALANFGDLTGADLTGADLTGADLYGANLTGANLTRADLTGADLTGANLTGANLTGANLTRADLTGADLTGAYLTGANLTGAYNIPGWINAKLSPEGIYTP